MRLDEVIRGIAITDRRGRYDTEITSITADSRAVTPGALFVAIRGLAHDGHRFIRDALKKGASAVLGEYWPDGVDTDDVRPAVVLVANSRRALALTAANYYGQPSRKLLVAGVTGTNGKTTVTYVLESIIKAASKQVGVLGTVECRYAGRRESLDHTTPDAVLLQAQMSKMLDHSVTHLAMEVSSHALDQERVAGLHFKVAGFTNLSQDHLDYHKTLDAYFEAKARLFSEFLRKSRARGRMAVVNIDDGHGEKILERWGGKSLRVSLDPEADAEIVALEATYGVDSTQAKIRTSKGVWDIETRLIGRFNLSNVLVGVGMALAMGFSKARILRGLQALERVPGRLEQVPNDEGKTVFVDYAHTPDALEKMLLALRPLTSGRLVVVFGCGGDRDQDKRPLMGRAVAAHADIAVVTNDNPRTEDPQTIAQAVEVGLREGGFTAMDAVPHAKQYTIELSRRAAIRTATNWLSADDVLVIAGKGHEDYQIIGTQKHRFDDREEARRILAGLPPPPPLIIEDRASEREMVQVVEAFDLLDEAPAPSTMQVEAEAIVEQVDLEPEILSEVEDDDGDAQTIDADPEVLDEFPAPPGGADAPANSALPAAPEVPAAAAADVLDEFPAPAEIVNAEDVAELIEDEGPQRTDAPEVLDATDVAEVLDEASDRESPDPAAKEDKP